MAFSFRFCPLSRILHFILYHSLNNVRTEQATGCRCSSRNPQIILFSNVLVAEMPCLSFCHLHFALSLAFTLPTYKNIWIFSCTRFVLSIFCYLQVDSFIYAYFQFLDNKILYFINCSKGNLSFGIDMPSIQSKCLLLFLQKHDFVFSCLLGKRCIQLRIRQFR